MDDRSVMQNHVASFGAIGMHNSSHAQPRVSGVVMPASSRTMQRSIGPLHEAVNANDVDRVSSSLRRGHAPDTIVDGVAPLHTVCWSGKEPIARLLIAYGADVNIISAAGFAPLHLASLYGHDSIVRVLLDNGARPVSTDRNGLTPAELAQWNGHAGIANLLLQWAHTYGPDGRADPTAAFETDDGNNNRVPPSPSLSSLSTRAKRRLFSGRSNTLKGQRSFEQLSMAAAGVKASLQSGTRNVLSRVASQPSLRSPSSTSLVSTGKPPPPPSPGISNFASSIAKGIRGRNHTVMGPAAWNPPSTPRQTTADPLHVRSRSSIENLGNAPKPRTSGQRSRGDSDPRLINSSQQTDTRSSSDTTCTAPPLIITTSSDTLPAPKSMQDDNTTFPSNDDLARWEAICNEQILSSTSPLSSESAIGKPKNGKQEEGQVMAPMQKMPSQHVQHHLPSDVWRADDSRQSDDIQEMLEQTWDADLASKRNTERSSSERAYLRSGTRPSHPSQNGAPTKSSQHGVAPKTLRMDDGSATAYADKTSSGRQAKSSGAEQRERSQTTHRSGAVEAAPTPNTARPSNTRQPIYATRTRAAMVLTHSDGNRLSASQHSQVILDCPRDGFAFRDARGITLSLQDLLAAYGEALAEERQKALWQAGKGAQTHERTARTVRQPMQKHTPSLSDPSNGPTTARSQRAEERECRTPLGTTMQIHR